MNVRLQKFLAEAGLGSRRNCEELIRAGRVTVNGEVAGLGDSADPAKDRIALDGNPLEAEPKEYWLLNKPLGVLSAVIDSRGRPTVTDQVPTDARIFPVGRLDLNSTGVMVLTNDGMLSERLLHPRYHVEKEYVVTVRGAVADSDLERLRRGVRLGEGEAVTSPASLAVVEGAGSTNGLLSTIKVVIREGRKRQVRRMFEAVGHRVLSLHRARFASLTDDGLALGQVRRLSSGEVAALRRMAGLL